MSQTKVRTFGELSAALQSRAGLHKSAARKGAAENDPTPEKDPTEKGQAAIPKDPDAAPAKQQVPESKTNADTQKVLPAPPVAKTVQGEEKAAGDLASKAAKVASGIKNLAASLSKKAEVTQPNMPPNDVKNDGADGGANKPPSGGAGAKNNPDPAVKDAAPSGAAAGATPKDPADAGKAPDPKPVDKGELPPDKTNTDAKTAGDMCPKCSKMVKDCGCPKEAASEGKAAAANDAPIDASFHLKLAHVILSTEEGRQFAQQQIEKYHGAQAAEDIVKAASIMEQKAEELAALEESGALVAEEMWKSASVEEQQGILKLAHVLAVGRNSYATEHEKAAYDAGAGAGAEMADAGMLADPSMMGGGDPAAGGMPPEGGAPGGEEAGMEEAIMAALDQMVQSGELTPEMAAQILQALSGGGEGGGAPAPGGDPAAMGGMPPEGGAPPAGGGGGAPPKKSKGGGDEGGGEEDEEKEAATKSAANRSAIDKLFAPAPAAKAA